MKPKPLHAAAVVVAVLACGLVAEVQPAEVEPPVFAKDVPGPSRTGRNLLEQNGEVETHNLGIYHGDVATRTQFPYQAALYVDLSVFCGGSLIHEKWVLTAAHCVDGGNRWYVLLGGTESITPKQEGRQTFVTRGGYLHPKYDKRNILNDVGVIQLMRRAPLSMYIQTVPLTPASGKWVGSLGTVAGYGKTDDTNAAPIAAQLQWTTLPIVDIKVCSDVYGDSSNHPSVLCLRAEGKSTCSGDSGGPTTVKDANGKLVQVGLVSFGHRRGCTQGYPVGHTNIAYLLPWISDTTGLNF